MPRWDRLRPAGSGQWWRRPRKRVEKKKPVALPPMRPISARGTLPWRRPVEPMPATPAPVMPVTPAAQAPFRRRPVEPMVPTPVFDLPTPSPMGAPMAVGAARPPAPRRAAPTAGIDPYGQLLPPQLGVRRAPIVTPPPVMGAEMLGAGMPMGVTGEFRPLGEDIRRGTEFIQGRMPAQVDERMLPISIPPPIGELPSRGAPPTGVMAPPPNIDADRDAREVFEATKKALAALKIDRAPIVAPPPIGVTGVPKEEPGIETVPPIGVVEETTGETPLFLQVMGERYRRATETGALPTVGEAGEILAVPIEMAIGYTSDQVTPPEGMEAREAGPVTTAEIPGVVPGMAPPVGVIGKPPLEERHNVAAESKEKHGDTEETQRAIVWSYSMSYSGTEAQTEAIDRMMAGEDAYVVCEWGHTTLENGKAIAQGMEDENPDIRTMAQGVVERYIAEDRHAQAHYAYRTTVLGEDHVTACKAIAENGGVETSQNVWLEAGGRIVFDPLTYFSFGLLDFYRSRHMEKFLAPGAEETAEVLIRGKGKKGALAWFFGPTPEFRSTEAQRVAHDFTAWAMDITKGSGYSPEHMVKLLASAGTGSDEALAALRHISPVVADATTSRMGKVATGTLNLVSESPGAPRVLKGGDGIAEFLAHGSKSIDDFVGVKPRPKALAWLGQTKGFISRYLHMGYNPAYAVRNLIGDTSQAIFDRSYRVVSGTEMSRFYDDALGYTPRAAAEGMGGAASEYITKTGLTGDLSKTGDRLRRHLMNKGVDEDTARLLTDAASTLGVEDLLKVTDEGLVNLYGEAAPEAMTILKRTLKKKWTSVLADGPAIALAGKFEKFTGERIVYGGAKDYLVKAQARWFRRNADELAGMPDEFIRLLKMRDIDGATELLEMAPIKVQAGGYALLHNFASSSDAWKLAAGQAGTMARDFTLHNYDARYGFDTVLGIVFQYPFWTSRTAAKWAIRAIDNPGMMGNALKLIQAVHEHNAGLSDYEKGSIHFHDVLGYHVSVPLLSLFVPYYSMYETYNDPRMEELPFGEYYQAVNSVASVNQLATWGLGLYYLASDDEDAQRAGRKMLAPTRQAKWAGGVIKGAAAAGVDVAQKVYAWGPSENRKIREQLAQQMLSGEITYEEAMIAVRDQNDLWDNAVERAAGEAILPVLAGLLVATPRVQDPVWQGEISGLYMMVGDLCDRREAGTITLEEWEAGWDLIGERYPWHGVLFEKPLDSQEKYAEIQRSLYYHEKGARDEEYRMERDAILREKPHAKQELVGLREQYEVDLDTLEKKYGQYREEVEGVEPPRDEYFPEERLQQQVLRSTGDALPHISDYTDAEGNPDYDALEVARADFWANVGDRVDVTAIAEAYGVEEDVVREALPDEDALTSYWRRNDSIPQAVNRIWRDEILSPAWEAYHAAVDAGADKSDAYEEHIESAEGMAAIDLLGKIQAAYPDRWTDGELRGELERIADIPSIEQATLERKEPEARALSEAKSSFWDFYNTQLPPGKMTRDIYDYPMVAAIMDAETRGTITTEQYARALEYMEAWKVKNADPDTWGPPADWAKAREQNEEFEDARDEHFDWEDIKRIQSQYYDLSRSERKAWLVKYPELKEYWDFRTWFGDQKGNELWRYYYLGKTTSAGAKAKRYYRKSGRRYYGRGRRGGGGERFYGTTKTPRFYLKAPDPWETAMRGKRFYARATPELFKGSYRTQPTPWLKSNVQGRLPWSGG